MGSLVKGFALRAPTTSYWHWTQSFKIANSISNQKRKTLNTLEAEEVCHLVQDICCLLKLICELLSSELPGHRNLPASFPPILR